MSPAGMWRIGSWMACLLYATLALGQPTAPSDLDLRRARPYYPYPFEGINWYDGYASTVTRDGLHYIGSTGYRYMYFGTFLRYLDKFHQARQQGVSLPWDPLDFQKFPKHAAMFDTFFDTTVAGGYYIPHGDTSGSPIEGRRLYSATTNWYNDATALAWKLSRDPRFAWMLVHVEAEKTHLASFSETEQAEIQRAAATVTRNPFLSTRPRVLGGIGLTVLEDGVDSDDYRFKRAMILVTGTSMGHSHADALDLQLFAHGCRMAVDIGCRDTKGDNFPRGLSTHMHNVVDVQSEDWPWAWYEEERRKDQPEIKPGSQDVVWNNIGNFPGLGEAYLLAFKPLPDYMYASGGAGSAHHEEIKVYRRQAVMITIDPGKPAVEPPSQPLYSPATRHDPKAVTPSLYVFDVFRVAGGKTHTWCFHGTDSDDFGVNVPVKPVGEDPLGPTRHNPSDCKASPAEHWLRHHPVAIKTDGSVPDKHEGIAGQVLEAFWQVSRTDGPRDMKMRVSVEFPHTVEGGETPWVWPKTGEVPMWKYNVERRYLGADYDPQAPRKITRISLLGHAGDQVMYARHAARDPGYGQNFPFLYVQQHRDDLSHQTVWPAIIEPYVGQSKIKALKLLEVDGLGPGEAGDALGPVAVSVQTAYGFTDVNFADGRPDKPRTVKLEGQTAAGYLTVAGELAYYSTDDRGLRSMSLVNGTQLTGAHGGVRVAQRQLQGKIIRCDYQAMKFYVDGVFPASVIGQEVLAESANLALPVSDSALQYRDPGDGHRTSFTVVSAVREGTGTLLQARRTSLMAAPAVLGVDADKGILTIQHPALLGTNPNKRAGMTFTNEAGTKTWKGRWLDGRWRGRGPSRFELSQAPVRTEDFTDANGDGVVSALIWDMGEGDVVRAPIHVYLRRTAADVYEYRADTDAALHLPGWKKIQISPDGVSWQALASTVDDRGMLNFSIKEDQLVQGRALLRLGR